jgi:hypothetical protein
MLAIGMAKYQNESPEHIKHNATANKVASTKTECRLILRTNGGTVERSAR